MYRLYGDGIHDDYPAIQEMIDSGVCEVSLPAPEKFYLISQTLVIPSNFRLVLPRFAEIRLADGANCFMVRNRWVDDRADRLPDSMDRFGRQLWNYIDKVSPLPEHVCENFEIIGGIWNANNMNQNPNPNPVFTPHPEDPSFTGVGMLFYNVKNFKISSLTLKDPTTFAVMIDRASYFTVEDITFDFNFGNPAPGNMDGIHLNGNCHHGLLRNLKGACYDDLVALNACEGSAGPITHIEIDGIFSEACHSAVRFLADRGPLAHVHISNVHGTFYTYCITFTSFTKCIDDISIDHIYAARVPRPYPPVPGMSRVYPLFHFDDNLQAKNIRIEALHRREYDVPVETIYISEGASIDTLQLLDVSTENHTDGPTPLLANHGQIGTLVLDQVRTDGDETIIGNGTVNQLIRR